MAFDGAFLYKTIKELKSATNCHIDKIHQPTKDELVFLLRKKEFSKRLLITVRSGAARLHFTGNRYENPAVPPMFCMLLRKYLSSARIMDIKQTGLERVAEITLSSTNEMGDLVELRLICELIGNQANVILVGSDGRIIDAIRRSDVETATRLILPGAIYEYPPSQQKLNPLASSPDDIANLIDVKKGEIAKQLLCVIDGFSPLLCRETENIYVSLLATVNNQKTALSTAIKNITDSILNSSQPTILFDENHTPFDFSFISISQYGDTFKKKNYASCSELLDAYYTSKDINSRINSEARDIIKLINNLRARTEKKLALRLSELQKCRDRENLRIYGELIKANLYNIKSGVSKAVVPNYYDEDMAEIEIPLNPALSPLKNADKYFKEYKKSYAAEQALTSLTLSDREEIAYFDTVTDSISRCKTITEINEIRDELMSGGYIKRQLQRKKSTAKPKITEYISIEGYRILVGKNNLQNDYITTKLSSKRDLWFHVKNIPGSHVVVLSDGNEVQDQTIVFAATLAATNSKASESQNVAVDYTEIKNVKKPNGAKLGMVIYTTNKTVYVNPDKKHL